MHCRRLIAPAIVALLVSAATAPAAPPPDQTSPLPNVTGCDTIDASACMLPFPNDLYTKADPSTKTGRRIDFNLLAMPQNVARKPIDPTDWNRADGFSPGSEIVTKITGLDTDQQLDAIHGADGIGVARLWSPEASLDADAPVAVIDATTGEKQMVWAELDHSMDVLGAAPGDRDLIVRPAKNFLEGHRYIVALRLGGTVTPDPTFVDFRDKGAPLTNPIDEQRRAHFESLFASLGAAGFARGSLTQAWDFTVATADNIAGRMLAIRNDAFHQLGDDDLGDLKVQGRAPAFTLQRVEDIGCAQGRPGDDAIVEDFGCPGGHDGPIAYDVKGSMTVPCYMDTPGCAPMHSTFVLDPQTNLPVQIPGNTMKVDFRCRIPQVALDHPGTSRPSLYGHGLFGSYNEVGQGQLKAMMAEHNFTYCATAWAGMATVDVGNALSVDADLSNFNTLGDRVQQGMLNFLYLGRLMIHPDGLCSQAPFNVDGTCILDTRRLFYDGNSQGGIIGGALTAVAPDFTRATLGVLGMNYSTLLSRSTDFGDGTSPLPPPLGNDGGLYAYPLYQAYPQANERQLLFGLIQMLWDRAEPDGYAQHMTSDPYPHTPAHQVMLMSAYGDHQVADITAEVEARTVGAKVLKPDMIRPWRTWELHPWAGLQAIDGFPARDTSVYTVWDGGSRPFPLENTAPTKAKDDDPHEWIRNTFLARAMKSYFLNVDSQVVDTCGGYCDTDSKSSDLDKDPLAGKRP
jgi:hypothetical protein